MCKHIIGIISAMPEENEKILDSAKITKTIKEGGRKYHFGYLFDQKVIIVFSRWGKVAAATTTIELIKNEAKEIIFAGVAGSPILEIGDIVIGNNVWQHDMNTFPFFNEYEIPMTGKSSFETNFNRKQSLIKASINFIETEFKPNQKYKITSPKIISGDIASGDAFLANEAKSKQIISKIPGVVCFEMEGGAVGQVCWEYDIPFSVIRIISDKAGENAPTSFPDFTTEIASPYLLEIFKRLFSNNDSYPYNTAKVIIKEWINKQGHDRCWYYPDLFNELISIFQIKSNKNPCLPPLMEFKNGCERYQKEEYQKEKMV